MDRMHNLGPRWWMVIGSVLVIAIGFVDALTGNELAVSLFYLGPIAAVTWFVGRPAGIAMCLLAAVCWIVADQVADQSVDSGIVLRIWNGLTRFGFFVIVALLLPALRALRLEQELARIDPLTQAANRRRLCETLHVELLRSRRYKRPMSLAFIDLDGFKKINDRLGHATGDRLLCAVVARIQSMVRQTDLLARVGGDEFVLLLPEIDQEPARTIVAKLQAALRDEMQRNHWPVTFSIGVLTWRDGAATAEDLIQYADKLMYDIKHNGKDAVAYALYEPAPTSRPVAGAALAGS